jgi:hypothetical protein
VNIEKQKSGKKKVRGEKNHVDVAQERALTSFSSTNYYSYLNHVDVAQDGNVQRCHKLNEGGGRRKGGKEKKYHVDIVQRRDVQRCRALPP